MLLLCVIVLLAAVVVTGLPHRGQTAKTGPSSDTITSSHFTSIEPSSQENSKIPTAASKQDEILYIVKEYKGHIGVFRGGDKLPFEEIDVDISVFPEEDRKLLRNGIQAKGTAELTRVIEDYEG